MHVHINSFVRRQTPDSRFTHFAQSNEELLARIEHNWDQRKPGYREGVVLVPVQPEDFFTGVCQLQEGDELRGKFEARREGETPRKTVTVAGRAKTPAKHVDIVLYASIVLAEDGSNELPAENGNWEIISINGTPFEGEMPIEPNVLMHNHFGSDGGTATGLSDSDFVTKLRESFRWWADKGFCGE